MTLDIPHILVTAFLVWGWLRIVDKVPYLSRMGTIRKAVMQAGGIFIAVLLLNLVWPYGMTA